MRRPRYTVVLLLLALVALRAGAEENSDERVDSDIEQVWSATVIGDFKFITDRHADNDVGSFFDQYEFTPNKSASVPFELGLRDFSYDRFGPGDTPKLQVRFDSSTSNLGLTGQEIDEPFFKQRAGWFERGDHIALDLEYWRFRSEALRRFPNTNGRQFDDATGDDDRFARERTGVFGELRIHPRTRESEGGHGLEWLSPEVFLRGGYESRDGTRQRRLIQEASNRWGAFSQPMDQRTTKLGTGLLIAPGDLFTLIVDVDVDRFRHQSSVRTESDLPAGFFPGDDSVGFIADTDRTTGTVRLRSRPSERVAFEAGFHASRLSQVHDLTPTQTSSGLDDNELLFYSSNAALDLALSEKVSFNAFVKHDQRRNRIDRDTALFNPEDDGAQVDAFLKRWDRVDSGGELIYHLHRSNLVALGARYEWIDRDLEFAEPSNLAILEPNARINDRTRMWTLYGRTNLRPLPGFGIAGEVGYRGAPRTGYILDLDKYVYGKMRASYVVPIETYVLVSAFVRGGSGENKDFSMRSGIGPDPSGDELPLSFERKDIAWGFTLTTYPLDNLSLFASYFQTRDDQKYDLVLSTLQRYWQSAVDIDFFEDGAPDSRNNQKAFSVGSHVRFSDSTDASLAYTFTRAELKYESPASSANVRRIADNRFIDSDIHGVQMELRHWLRDGLRLQVGYRLQRFDDSSARSNAAGSTVSPVSPSQTQHTATLGVTLTSELFANPENDSE